jgi:hypothetical protein
MGSKCRSDVRFRNFKTSTTAAVTTVSELVGETSATSIAAGVESPERDFSTTLYALAAMNVETELKFVQTARIRMAIPRFSMIKRRGGDVKRHTNEQFNNFWIFYVVTPIGRNKSSLSR